VALPGSRPARALTAAYSWQNACCDDTQYMSLKVGLSQLSALFGRCPACQRNLATLLCAAVCSPNQSQFVSVVATVPGASNQSLVTLASLSLSVDFAQGLYASCSNVQFASSNTTVFQLVFGATDQLSFFYRFGASMQPPLSFALGAPGSPFAFSSAIAACNDSSAALHCRCQDCPAACGSVQCDPYWECPTGSTCCPNNSGGFNCCPYVDATCCSDNVHCCPPDYPICNLSAGQCQSSVGARELAPRWPAQRRLT
jgi:hypothetical protein